MESAIRGTATTRRNENDSVLSLHFSGAKIEAEMKNVICQDCRGSYVYNDAQSRPVRGGIARNFSFFYLRSHLLEAFGWFACYRERRSPNLLLIAYRSVLVPALYQFPSKSSRFRVHALFCGSLHMSLSSITVARPPLSCFFCARPRIPRAIKSRFNCYAIWFINGSDRPSTIMTIKPLAKLSNGLRERIVRDVDWKVNEYWLRGIRDFEIPCTDWILNTFYIQLFIYLLFI